MLAMRCVPYRRLKYQILPIYLGPNSRARVAYANIVSAMKSVKISPSISSRSGRPAAKYGHVGAVRQDF